MTTRTNHLKHLTLLGALGLSVAAPACGTAADEVVPAEQAIIGGQTAPKASVAANAARPGPERWLDRFDANEDGVLEVSELPARPRERLAALDTNGDGKLSADETNSARAVYVKERFSNIDSNNDGKLTEQEAGFRWQRLALADGNKDGTVTLEEMTSAHERGVLGPPRGRRGPNGRQGDPGWGPERMGQGDGGGLFDRFDGNGDGQLTSDEAPAPAWEHIAPADTNKDGAVSREELKTAKANGTVTLKGGGRGPRWGR